MSDHYEESIEDRKKRVMDFLKKKYDWLAYVVLAVIIWIALFIRTRNLPGLKDVTNGQWTLGPDLDPFLFLRWAKYIIENGSLMAIDTMRYVPLGFDTKVELILLPYMIAWFHKAAFALGIAESVTHSAVLFPVFMFALTIIAFFFLVREIFIDTNGKPRAQAIALLSCLFLSIIPALLPRTIAGIPEKESAAFFFMFMAFYFFICAWKSGSKYGKYVHALLAGLFTAGMALVWGGYIYVILTIAISLFISLIIYQADMKKLYISLIWLISSSVVMGMFSVRYSLENAIRSTIMEIAIAAVLMVGVYALWPKLGLKRYIEGGKLSKIPLPVLSIIVTGIALFVFAFLLFGSDFIVKVITNLTSPLITPISERIGVTVAENRQPYFSEWASSFGPIMLGVPIFFWIFLLGSIYLYYQMMKVFPQKGRIYSTAGYAIFLVAIIFSRYSPNSILNGTNAASILFYLLGVLALIGSFGYYYYRNFRENDTERVKSIDFGSILLFSLFFFSIISARGGVRVIMVLVPPASIMASYLAVSLFGKAIKPKEQRSNFAWVLVGIIIVALIFSSFRFYQESKFTAENYIPSIYNQQWQKAMGWVRESTPENAVFAHWWDYGYWVQSIGERATVLDGGNAQAFWDHLMGRYALTEPNRANTLDFFYAHGVTHFLIDSTDIGKYTAFSSIGSDKDYDRRSWISTFLRDDAQIFETKNATTFFYRGGFSLDDDVVYRKNGTEIFLPGMNDGKSQNMNLAGLGAVGLSIGKNGSISQPEGIFIYQSKQYNIPIRYAFYDGKLIDFGSGIESGVFLFPRADQSGSQISIVKDGALLYLSERTVHSQLARLYLYGEQDENFIIAHAEDDFFVTSIRAQGANVSDFVYYGGIRGPIKIWDIRYPQGMEVKEEYLETYWPEELREV